MNIQDIGYFLYMQEQENKDIQDKLKINVNSNPDLVGEKTTQNREDK